MSDLPKFNVWTERSKEPVLGSQFAVITTPPELYVVLDGKRAMDVRVLGRFLREASETTAAQAGQTLHHASWVITSDPEVVREAGSCGSELCTGCVAGMDQALAWLADKKRDLAVGTLYWVG